MAYSITTQGQAITFVDALRACIQNVAGTPASQVGAVQTFFARVLGSASPAVTSTQAATVIAILRDASFGNSDIPAAQIADANTIGSYLLNTTVHSTVLQAQAVLNAVWVAYQSIADAPAAQVEAVNNLITALQAL